ncbi:MAG: TIR domain-containing protein [Pseudomonadota bacterium]
MPASDPKKQAGVFISYRRSDNPDATGRIYDRLVSEFGRARVFKDVDSIPLGQDFRGHLNDVVGGCAAVLAIIGPKWIDTRNGSGQRRLEDPDDFVRIELEAALARDVPVVPVLVGHAPMPGSTDLPASLASMVFRQSIEVRPDPDFHHDATRLVAALRKILDPDAPDVALAIAPQTRSPSGPRLAWSIAALTGIAAAALVIPAWRFLHVGLPPETRVDIVTPDTDLPLDFALSPDGKQIVFVAKGGGASRLWLRSLAASTAQSLPGTEGAANPFWSPDSRSVAFFAAGELKRFDLGAGQPRTLAVVRVGGVGRGAWSAQGVILFPQGPSNPLLSVADTGGATKVALESSPEFGWPTGPQFLPGDRQFLVVYRDGTVDGTYLGTLNGHPPVRLTEDTGPVAYLPSGWMLWIRAGALVAQKLDLEKSALTGQLLTVADGAGSVSIATRGLVAYRAGGTRGRQLKWMDQAGKALGTIGDPDDTLSGPRVSHDGRVAFSREAQGNVDVWLQDGTRTSSVTFDASVEGNPVWSPDGERIVFTSLRSGKPDIHQKLSSGAGVDEQLLTSSQAIFPTSWSADGRYLLYSILDPETGWDLWVLPMTGDRKPFVFLRAPADQVWGQFSPDGRWVAYRSSESNRNEVYVRPFVPPGSANAGSDAPSGQWQISTDGGAHATWRADGKELFYVNPDGALMAVPIAVKGATLVPGAPRLLFQSHVVGGAVLGLQYDVAPDGRFLINTELDISSTPPITLIQNWNPEAKKPQL